MYVHVCMQWWTWNTVTTLTLVAFDSFLATDENPEKTILAQIESDIATRSRETGRSSKTLQSASTFVENSVLHWSTMKVQTRAISSPWSNSVGSGDKILKNHLATCDTNARYSSKTIQNQLIALIGHHIRHSINHEIKEAKYFSVLCDEVTDDANLEQLSFTLRFFDKNCKIHKHFFEFQCTEQITGEVISRLILGNLEQWGLGILDCRGQGHDSASNMPSQAWSARFNYPEKLQGSVRTLQFACPESHCS